MYYTTATRTGALVEWILLRILVRRTATPHATCKICPNLLGFVPTCFTYGTWRLGLSSDLNFRYGKLFKGSSLTNLEIRKRFQVIIFCISLVS
jgi:hypothetical protein